ncbi:protein of unknown function [uncultured Woeseiaceae bacterium]|uniref:Uncharacterized protein n=1 Tax=uncultured Woeseiaceae bacterium TaxID=1983305 RepID=A0A7D9H5I2_9GAMM|nr:protein of unknown function [uncultured Woeseiaceae bacterium]
MLGSFSLYILLSHLGAGGAGFFLNFDQMSHLVVESKAEFGIRFYPNCLSFNCLRWPDPEFPLTLGNPGLGTKMGT